MDLLQKDFIFAQKNQTFCLLNFVLSLASFPQIICMSIELLPYGLCIWNIKFIANIWISILIFNQNSFQNWVNIPWITGKLLY